MMREFFVLEQQDFHFALDMRMGIMKAFVVDHGNVFGGNHKVHQFAGHLLK